MADMTPKQIAAGLSEAQRKLVREGYWYGQRGWRLDRQSATLQKLGLQLKGSVYLLPLFHEVRAELENRDD